MTLIVYVFLKLEPAKDVLRTTRFRTLFQIQHAKGPKHYWSLDYGTFIIIIHHSEKNRVEKCLP